MNDDSNLLAHVIELETKLAFQDETIETLNAVVTRLQATVERLTQEMTALKAQLRSVAPTTGGQADEKPPHY